MTRPNIPGDVMEVAVSIEKDIPSRVTGANRVFIRAVIARAILAERERCAKACSAEAAQAKRNGLPHVAMGAMWCATAIRAGGTA